MFFAPRFFGYEEEIRRKLSSLGARVDYYDQRPSNTSLAKALIRINKRLLANRINDYYSMIINNTSTTEYDYILFITPEAITREAFISLKEAQPTAKFILYMWDSLRNKRSNVNDILGLFDKRFSFDKKDCLSSKWEMHYRPLFFLNEYSDIKLTTPREYELLFIGTIHSDRHRILMQLREYCKTNKLNFFCYMFLPSRLLYFYRSIRHKSIRQAGIDAFEYKPLSKRDVIALMERSNVVVDIEHPNQSGLTIRTIEVLGAQRKLITTNEDIVNYDFYNPQNILLIDRHSLKIDLNFFRSQVIPVEPEIYMKYSIDGWISDIFGLQKQPVPTIA